jgi:hypothetical protein
LRIKQATCDLPTWLMNTWGPPGVPSRVSGEDRAKPRRYLLPARSLVVSTVPRRQDTVGCRRRSNGKFFPAVARSSASTRGTAFDPPPCVDSISGLCLSRISRGSGSPDSEARRSRSRTAAPTTPGLTGRQEEDRRFGGLRAVRAAGVCCTAVSSTACDSLS